jgi:hypothetical protein
MKLGEAGLFEAFEKVIGKDKVKAYQRIQKIKNKITKTDRKTHPEKYEALKKRLGEQYEVLR